MTPSQLSVSVQEQDETHSLDSNSDTVPKTPPSKASSLSPNASNVPTSQTPMATSSIPSPSTSPSVPGSISGRGILEGSMPSSPVNPPSVAKEEDAVSFPSRRSSPALTDPTPLARGIGRGSISSQPAVNVPLSSAAAVPSSSMTLGAVPLTSDVSKKNILGSDERLASSGMVQPMTIILSSMMNLLQCSDLID